MRETTSGINRPSSSYSGGSEDQDETNTIRHGASVDINQSGPGPRLMTADTLTGDKVVNRNDDDLGTLKEIMLDVVRGRIAYAVLATGGFMGIAEKLFAVPWNALTLDTERKCFILDVDKAVFETAPGFDKDHWPEAPDMTWHNQVHQHYGSRAYWL